MEFVISSVEAMMTFGNKLGAVLRGGEVIELIGDIGAGKTTLTKGIAQGLGVKDDVQSPTFTISRTYTARNDLVLAHYDFYRLVDAGIMTMELHESVSDPHIVTVLEWAGIVAGVLPKDTLTIRIESMTELSRRVTLTAGGAKARRLMEVVK